MWMWYSAAWLQRMEVSMLAKEKEALMKKYIPDEKKRREYWKECHALEDKAYKTEKRGFLIAIVLVLTLAVGLRIFLRQAGLDL